MARDAIRPQVEVVVLKVGDGSGGRRVEGGGGPVVVTWRGAGIGVVVAWNDERDGSK
jgi:hypothetical protein